MTADRLQDPVFKQSYGFAREGETLRIEIWTEPGGGVRAEHVHPVLEERYEVLEGETMITLDGEASRLGPGGRVVVPPGTPHSFQNAGAGTAHLIVEAEPAQELRKSIEDGARLTQAERFPRTARSGAFARSSRPRRCRSARGVFSAGAAAPSVAGASQRIRPTDWRRACPP